MFRRTAIAWFIVSCILGGPASRASGEVKTHALFSDGMVLQQGMKAPVWGTADDGEQVVVRFQDQQVSTTAKDGKWMVRLPALKAGGPFKMVITGKNTIRFEKVLVGEVWICGGQSNMEFPVSVSANAKDAVASSKNPMLRLFTVAHRTASSPRHTVSGTWKECSPETVGNFTAVGYFFGRDLQKALGVPVGLIQSCWGGTLCEAWTSRQGLAKHPDFQDIDAIQARAWERYAQALKKYEEAREKQEEMLERAPAEKRRLSPDGRQAPRSPQPPANPAHDPNMPASLYNGMIAPLIPYAIRVRHLVPGRV